MMTETFITMDDACTELAVARGTLHYYITRLDLKTHKFPLDRKKYLSTADFETIKEVKGQVGKSGAKSGEIVPEKTI